jgi:hypothetical protein
LPGQREAKSPVPTINSCSGDPSRLAHFTDLGFGCSVSGDPPGTVADAGSVPSIPGVTACDPRIRQQQEA